MDDVFARFIIYAIIIVAASFVGLWIGNVRGKKDLAALPEGSERIRLLNEIRQMRKNNAGHAECLAYLRNQGLRKGVAESLIIDVEREQPPDLENIKTIEWKDYQISYPGNWKLNPLATSLPMEQGFSIEGLGSAIILFQEIDDDVEPDKIVAEYTTGFENTSEKRFNLWGIFEGDGRTIKGVQKLGKIEAETRVFFPTNASAKIVIVQVYATEETDFVEPGFDLIRSSLKTIN